MLQVFTSTEDGTGVGTAQKTITKEVLPIVNEIAMAATPFSTTTPCCDQPKVTLLDMNTKPMCQQVDTSFEDVVVVEDTSDDGKLNEDTIQHYADCLKKLLPPDVLERLMGLKGREFWSMLAEVAFHLV